MTDTTFPSSGDPLDKASLRRAFKLTANAQDYVISGLDAIPGGGLSVTVHAGSGFVNGTYISRSVDTNVNPLAASATNYIWVGYSDAARNTVVMTSNTTGVSPGANYMLVATAITDGSTVTSITDNRGFVAVSGWGAT